MDIDSETEREVCENISIKCSYKKIFEQLCGKRKFSSLT